MHDSPAPRSCPIDIYFLLWVRTCKSVPRLHAASKAANAGWLAPVFPKVKATTAPIMGALIHACMLRPAARLGMRDGVHHT